MRCSLGGIEEIKGERIEIQSDGTEHHHQNGLDLGVFEVQIIRFLIKKALLLYAELCLLLWRGTHFQKNHEKSGSNVKMMVEKWKNDAERA